MSRISLAITAVAIVPLATLLSGSAQAGGATSAPSRYNNTTHIVVVKQARNPGRLYATGYTITEFSSSSAKSSVPKR
jgi:hypothetical protein